jgi:hypothetical protein
LHLCSCHGTCCTRCDAETACWFANPLHVCRRPLTIGTHQRTHSLQTRARTHTHTHTRTSSTHIRAEDFITWAQMPVAIWNGLDSSVWPPKVRAGASHIFERAFESVTLVSPPPPARFSFFGVHPSAGNTVRQRGHLHGVSDTGTWSGSRWKKPWHRQRLPRFVQQQGLAPVHDWDSDCNCGRCRLRHRRTPCKLVQGKI